VNRLDLRAWLLLGMGLAGMLTVALIVTADESAAGIDGVRAIRALVPAAEQDHPDGASPASSFPLIGGLVAIVRDFAPSIFGVASGAPSSDVAQSPAGPSPQPANSPSPRVLPTVSVVPAVQQPASATPQPAVATPPPSVTSPAPTSSPAPTARPTAPPFDPDPPVPSATPSPTPAPSGTLAITTDRGGTAIVNLSHLIPGDTISRTITVTNSGSLGFRYTVSATHTATTALWTDTTRGLQLSVSTSGGTVLYSGPLSGLSALAGPTVLAAGASETLHYDFTFPAGAPNSFQSLSQDLTLVFDAVQSP
jgi:spore coat-associated protein N